MKNSRENKIFFWTIIPIAVAISIVIFFLSFLVIKNFYSPYENYEKIADLEKRVADMEKSQQPKKKKRVVAQRVEQIIFALPVNTKAVVVKEEQLPPVKKEALEQITFVLPATIEVVVKEEKLPPEPQVVIPVVPVMVVPVVPVVPAAVPVPPGKKVVYIFNQSSADIKISATKKDERKNIHYHVNSRHILPISYDGYYGIELSSKRGLLTVFSNQKEDFSGGPWVWVFSDKSSYRTQDLSILPSRNQ